MGTTKAVVPAVENDLRVENTKRELSHRWREGSPCYKTDVFAQPRVMYGGEQRVALRGRRERV